MTYLPGQAWHFIIIVYGLLGFFFFFIRQVIWHLADLWKNVPAFVSASRLRCLQNPIPWLKGNQRLTFWANLQVTQQSMGQRWSKTPLQCPAIPLISIITASYNQGDGLLNNASNQEINLNSVKSCQSGYFLRLVVSF